MKKVISLLLIVILVLALSGCATAKEDHYKLLKNDAYKLYDQLRPAFTNAVSNQEIRDYIATIADEKGIYYKLLPEDSIVLVKQADKGRESTPSTTIHCGISIYNPKETSQTVALALSILTNSEDQGKISLIFTSETGDHLSGAESLPDEYLNTDNLIDLTYYPEPQLYTGSAATTSMELAGKNTWVTPAYTKAYRISITGLSGGPSYDQSYNHPNPIITLGKLISSCQNSGLLLQVASINGGSSADTYPTSAELVVVVNQNDESKFLKRVDRAKESFSDTYKDIETNMKFTYEAIEVPELVLSDDDSSRLASLMYTAQDGIVSTTEKDKKGQILSTCNVGTVMTTNDEVRFSLLGRCTSQEELDNLITSYSQIAYLNSYDLTVLGNTGLWQASKENKLSDSISIATKQSGLNLTPSISFHKSPCAIFSQKNPDLLMVSLGVKIQDAAEVTKSLDLFLDSLNKAYMP